MLFFASQMKEKKITKKKKDNKQRKIVRLDKSIVIVEG